MTSNVITNELKSVFTPNSKVGYKTTIILLTLQIIAALAFWFYSDLKLLPSLPEVLTSFSTLMSKPAFLTDLGASIGLSVESMIATVIISLLISYASLIPFFRPTSRFVTLLRYSSLVGIQFIFMLAFNSHNVKVALLTFSMTVFFTTSMMAAINEIPQTQFNLARTMRMNEWEVLWRVVILGKLDAVFDVMRQTFAMSWMMLTMVETITRSEGGIGVVLTDSNKYFRLADIFAILIIILVVGLIQDAFFGFLKTMFRPNTVTQSNKGSFKFGLPKFTTVKKATPNVPQEETQAVAQPVA